MTNYNASRYVSFMVIVGDNLLQVAFVVQTAGELVFRCLMDVCLQQNLTPDLDVMGNSLAKVIIMNMLNSIPTKRDKVFLILVMIVIITKLSTFI